MGRFQGAGKVQAQGIKLPYFPHIESSYVCRVDKFFETVPARIGAASIILNLTILDTSTPEQTRVGGQHAIVNKLDKEVAFASVKAALLALGENAEDLEGTAGETRMADLIPVAPAELSEDFQGAMLRILTSPAVSREGNDYTRVSYAPLEDENMEKYFKIAADLTGC